MLSGTEDEGQKAPPPSESPFYSSLIDTNSRLYWTLLCNLHVFPLEQSPFHQPNTSEAIRYMSGVTGKPAPKQRGVKVTVQVSRLVIKHCR